MANQKQEQKQEQVSTFVWGRVAGFAVCVAAPVGLIAYANADVFPDSALMASGMAFIGAGVALIFTVASGYATPKVRRYILLSLLFLGVVLSINLVAHWALKREKSGAQLATTAREREDDRARDRRKEQTEQSLQLLTAQKELADSQKGALRMEAVRNDSARRLGLRAPRSMAPMMAPEAVPTISAAPPLPAPGKAQEEEPPLTVEQVLKKWAPRFVWLAALDLFASVIAFGICAAVWEWDLDGDGRADHLQAGRGSVPYSQQSPGFVQPLAQSNPEQQRKKP